MLPMRLILPLHASMASHSMVFPDEAWPTTAKLRMSAGDVVAITWNPSWNENARKSSRAQAEMSGRRKTGLNGAVRRPDPGNHFGPSLHPLLKPFQGLVFSSRHQG